MNAQIDAIDTRLRALARDIGETPAQLRPLPGIWQELIAGQWTVADAFLDETYCYVVLRALAEKGKTLCSRELRVLEHVLGGAGQKPIAIDLGISFYTIASITKRALALLGVHCLPSRVPLSLVVFARAGDSAQCAVLLQDGVEYQVVRLPRPDGKLRSLLPPAEGEVVRARLEGQSHRRIAVVRRTSPRTVANQLASAARRLGVSGRLETINLLLTSDALKCLSQAS